MKPSVSLVVNISIQLLYSHIHGCIIREGSILVLVMWFTAKTGVSIYPQIWYKTMLITHVHVVMEIFHHLDEKYPLPVVKIPPMVFSHQICVLYPLNSVRNMNLVVKFHFSFCSDCMHVL